MTMHTRYSISTTSTEPNTPAHDNAVCITPRSHPHVSAKPHCPLRRRPCSIQTQIPVISVQPSLSPSRSLSFIFRWTHCSPSCEHKSQFSTLGHTPHLSRPCTCCTVGCRPCGFSFFLLCSALVRRQPHVAGLGRDGGVPSCSRVRDLRWGAGHNAHPYAPLRNRDTPLLVHRLACMQVPFFL